jgi:hypothetical protein
MHLIYIRTYHCNIFRQVVNLYFTKYEGKYFMEPYNVMSETNLALQQ